MFLLKCLCSDETSTSIQSDQEEHYVSDSSDVTLATSAACAFHVIMSDSEVCLNKNFHSRIKPLYKQLFFSIFMTNFLSKIKESTAIITRQVLIFLLFYFDIFHWYCMFFQSDASLIFLLKCIIKFSLETSSFHLTVLAKYRCYGTANQITKYVTHLCEKKGQVMNFQLIPSMWQIKTNTLLI